MPIANKAKGEGKERSIWSVSVKVQEHDWSFGPEYEKIGGGLENDDGILKNTRRTPNVNIRRGRLAEKRAGLSFAPPLHAAGNPNWYTLLIRPVRPTTIQSKKPSVILKVTHR